MKNATAFVCFKILLQFSILCGSLKFSKNIFCMSYHHFQNLINLLAITDYHNIDIYLSIVIDSDSAFWIPTDPTGSRWIPMDPDGSRWIPMDPSGSRDPDGSRRIPLDPLGSRDPLFPPW